MNQRELIRDYNSLPHGYLNHPFQIYKEHFEARP